MRFAVGISAYRWELGGGGGFAKNVQILAAIKNKKNILKVV